MLDEVPVAFVIAADGAPSDLHDRIIIVCAKKLADYNWVWVSGICDK